MMMNIICIHKDVMICNSLSNLLRGTKSEIIGHFQGGFQVSRKKQIVIKNDSNVSDLQDSLIALQLGLSKVKTLLQTQDQFVRVTR